MKVCCCRELKDDSTLVDLIYHAYLPKSMSIVDPANDDLIEKGPTYAAQTNHQVGFFIIIP